MTSLSERARTWLMGLRARAAPILAGSGPVLDRAFRSSRAQGLAQLNTAAQQGFSTGTEARCFQMRILGSAREHQPAAALAAARLLANDFPDNACFARSYAT